LASDRKINRFQVQNNHPCKNRGCGGSDLEKRLRRLSTTTKREASGASDDIGEFVSDALDRITSRVRESAAGVTQSVSDEAKRFSGDAFRKLTDEVENRPLLMLSVAAGIGFLAGLANRR
jgi:ElaB/YqjD/DUF883 family membrane-anchored ribosome-binding protein